MSIPAAWPQVLDFFGIPLVIEPSPGQLSSDAGLLPVRQFDERIGLSRAITLALDDLSDPDDAEHTRLRMVGLSPPAVTMLRFDFGMWLHGEGTQVETPCAHDSLLGPLDSGRSLPATIAATQ